MYVMWDVLRRQEGRSFFNITLCFLFFVLCLWLITVTCRVEREMYVLYYFVAKKIKNRNHKKIYFFS